MTIEDLGRPPEQTGSLPPGNAGPVGHSRDIAANRGQVILDP